MSAPPRRCIGLWQPVSGRRLLCPHAQTVPETGTTAQCRACTAADAGQRLAQDRDLDDEREFVLYLAWFGGDLVKVGLTAAERGSDRLAEQGALAFTGLARGPLLPIRRLERHIASAGLARERVPTTSKFPHWWRLPDSDTRHAVVADAHQRAQAALEWPATVRQLPLQVVDQVARFGLDRPLPRSYRHVTGLRTGSTIAGQATAIVGRHLLLDTGGEHLLVDLRLLAGWSQPDPTTSDRSPTQARALDLAQARRTHPDCHHDDVLF